MTQHRYLSGRALVCDDNINPLRDLPDNCIDLIYLDPPFNSNQFYVAAFGDKGLVSQQLRDIWRWTEASQRSLDRLPHGPLRDCVDGVRLQTGKRSSMAAYILYMGIRLSEMQRLLKPSGSLYLHCDPHANAYLRVLMDTIFGEKQFRNEIIWCYAPSGAPPKYGFHRKHDSILYYSKGDKPHFRHLHTQMDSKTLATYNHVDKNGRRYKESPGGRSYLDKQQGRPIPSWWTDIPSFGTATNNPERLGYPTQKPRALLERIIAASSNPGDLVLDPFCGCGTAADAAAALGRGYLGVDISGVAVRVMQQRLESREPNLPPDVYGLGWDEISWTKFEKLAFRPREESEDGVPGWAWAEDRVAAMLNAVPNQRKTSDEGVDVRYYAARDLHAQGAPIVVPIQVKAWRSDRRVGRPEGQNLRAAQIDMQRNKTHAPMSMMVSLYPPARTLREYAASHGEVAIRTQKEGLRAYPVMQALSVKEMLEKDERPSLPPADPTSLVGDTQTRMQTPKAP